MKKREKRITADEDACLRKYCVRKWPEKGEDILHRAYLRAFATKNFNPDFQARDNRTRKRSPFYNYVAAILVSAFEAEQLGSGWTKGTRKVAKPEERMEKKHSSITVRNESGDVIDVILPCICHKKRVWEEAEILASVISTDNDGREHGIEDYADPHSLDEEELSRDLDAEELASWFIAEVNAYALHLQSICEYDKLMVLKAKCTKEVKLNHLATEKGLTHSNLNAIVIKVLNDLAETDRLGIPSGGVQRGLDIIRKEPKLSSQLVIVSHVV